jgi:RNA polymerase sigma-70 factor (family 1)
MNKKFQKYNGEDESSRQFSLLSTNEDLESGIGKILDNERILRQAIEKNPQIGFKMLFKIYYKPLCSHAIRYVYSKEIAEDLVSEIFLNMWSKNLFMNINKSSYRTYLYQALRNSIYNYLDKEYRKKEYQKNISLFESSKSENVTPQTIILIDELSNKIQRAIDSLPPQCKKVFLLSRIEGKKYHEIAEELKIKSKTVEAHMMKAISSLKETVQSYLK